MPSKKKPFRSLLFCEYVVGTTIPAALGPIPKKSPKKREVVTVEVVTDDETEEDTVKITYPRSGRSLKSGGSTDTAVKKVRFEEGPKKSALKKPASSDSEDTPAESEADASAESTDSKADEPKSPKKEKAKKSKAKETEANKPSDSEDDSEPHPTCECTKCIRGRQKRRREAKRTSKDAAVSDSDSEVTTDDESEKGLKNGETKGKSKEKEKEKEKENPQSSEGESQEESAKDTDDSEAEKKKQPKQQGKKNKNKNTDGNKDQAKAKTEKKGDDCNEKTESKEPEMETKKPEIEASDKKVSPKEKTIDLQRESRYPAAYPGPHPRRPNLIAPMRAEVVHTERVVETPEDPIPNAYYDAENNIIRIYHGPVYGHHHQSLYPKRDPSLRPLPIGMPHPTQNPYYHGFDRGQDKPSMEHVPITQGMPMPPWNAFAPAGFPGYPGAYPTPLRPMMDPGAQNQNPGQNKGAFNLVNSGPAAAVAAAAGAPSSKDQDIAGGNNVYPPGKDNPYIPRKSKSQFSTYGGSNHSMLNGSPNKTLHDSRADKAGRGQADQQQQSEWGPGNSNGNNIENSFGSGNGAEASGWGGQSQQQNWDDANNGGQKGSQFNAGDAQDTSWNNNDGGGSGGWPVTEQPDAGTTWENQDTQYGNADAGSQWNNDAQGDGIPVKEHNNVMPGTWNAPMETPSWGDPTMAASTGGRVNGW